MNSRFDGKRALVTGSGKGIGRAIAVALYERGATVFALSKTQENLDTLKTQCPNINTVCVDLGDWSATRQTVKSLGDIDLLVNNAGIVILQPFLNVDEDSYDGGMNVNLKAVLNISQVVAQGMKERGSGGSIVNISSQAGLRALHEHTVYCSSKAALNMMTKCMALELGPYKIRTNSVCPTVVMTEMGRLAWSDPKKGEAMLKRIPLGRFAEIEDCVRPVLFLLSDDSAMVNGVELPVDGGFHV